MSTSDLRKTFHDMSELLAEADDTFDPDAVKHLDPVHAAAIFIEDALLYTIHTHPCAGELPRTLHLVQLKIRPFVKWALLLLVLMSFFELPPWCAVDPLCVASLSGGQLHGAYRSGFPFFFHNQTRSQQIVYPLFGLPIVPPHVGSVLELLIQLVLLIHLICMIGAQGSRRFFFPWTEKGQKASYLQPVYALLLFIAWVDSMVRVSGHPWPAGYIAPYTRIALLCVDSPAILSELGLVRKTLKPLSGVAIVLFFFLGFMAWFGILLYADADPLSQGALYFTDFFETMWQLFICLTTANYPDVMMPAYTASRFSFSFFFIFIAIGTFFMCNVVVAVVCNAYNEQVERNREAREAFRAARLDQAFKLLDAADTTQYGTISRQRIEEVFRELNFYNMGLARITPDRSRLLFAMLDSNQEGAIGPEDFQVICHLLAVRFKKVDRTTWITHTCPAFWSHPLLVKNEQLVRHRGFDIAIDVMLSINAIILVVEEWDILSGASNDYDPHKYPWAQWVEIIFTCIFACEMSMKLAGFGFYGYVASLSNCFDGTVTIASMTIAVVSCFEEDTVRSAIRYVLALRLGRFARLLGLFPQVAVVVATFVRMLPAAAKLLKVLFVTMFVFSTLGVQLFGGIINYGPNGAVLAATTFGEANYYANNFNDLASGFVVCFELLVVNNWFIIAKGFSAVAPMPLVRIFFVAVYIFGVLVCLNIVIAFAIESFDAVQAANAAEKEAAEGGEGSAPETDRVSVRDHSDSISAAARRYRPVIPVSLKGTEAVKARLKNITAGSGGLLPAEYRGSELSDAGGGRGALDDKNTV